MEQPTNCDPVAWALYNAYLAQNIAVVQWPTVDAAITDFAVEVVELPASFQDLDLAIRRAASELENQGEKSDRIAMQLLTALALFRAETGT